MGGGGERNTCCAIPRVRCQGDRSSHHMTIQTHGLDKYRRIIGDVILLDGMNLNHEL